MLVTVLESRGRRNCTQISCQNLAQRPNTSLSKPSARCLSCFQRASVLTQTRPLRSRFLSQQPVISRSKPTFRLRLDHGHSETRTPAPLVLPNGYMTFERPQNRIRMLSPKRLPAASFVRILTQHGSPTKSEPLNRPLPMSLMRVGSSEIVAS